LIPQGTFYYRDDNLFERVKHGAAARHYCASCILGKDSRNGVTSNYSSEDPYQFVFPFGKPVIIHPTRIEVVDVTEPLLRQLLWNYDEIYDLSPESFEDLVQGRICAMGYVAKRVGHTFGRDGGIDILFWPAPPCPVPFLGAVQAKHHRVRHRKTGPGPLREMAGIMSSRPIHIGMIVTNTSFTADAQWFAAHQPAIIRLRDMRDLKRWIASDFTDEAEWREMPVVLELSAGISIDLSNKGGSGLDRA
jgi:hypothetical protein